MALNNSDRVTFLLVEDDDLDARAVEEAFAAQKITNPIVRARSGLEALEILRGDGDRDRLPRPYLILLDLRMPQMSGIEFLQELRKDADLKRNIVFVLSTSDDEFDRTAAYKQHVAGYLLKHEAGEKFVDAIRMLNYFQLSVRFPDD